MIVRQLKSIPRDERGFSAFSLGHCDSFLCNTNTRYVLGPNKSVVSGRLIGAPTRLRRYPTIVPGASTEYLSTRHPRRCTPPVPGRRASLITSALRSRAVLILRPRCAARQLPTRQCTCVMYVCVCHWILTLGRGPV